MPASELRTTFRAPAARVAWLSDVICANVRTKDAPVRILDVGCGAGDQLFDLAQRLPHAHMVGVDIERANVAAANARLGSEPYGDRLTFTEADYLTYRATQPFDIVTSYSVLHMVPGATSPIASRITEDTVAGGLFINVMPYRCPYNQVLREVRRMLRAVRSRATDRLFMAAARALHGRSFDDELLAERIAYTYAVPPRFDDDLASELAQRGFETTRFEAVAHASLAQMKHALRIMRRSI